MVNSYLEIYGHRNEKEAQKAYPLLARILNRTDSEDKSSLMILDLACGAGRYAILLASEGYRVTGVDLSRPLLDEALKKWNDLSKGNKGGTLELVRSDMRKLPFRKSFNLIINMFTSFGYFESDSENERVIKTISDHLVTDGNFVIDYLNRDSVIANLQEESESRVGEYSIVQHRWLTEDNKRVEKKVEVLDVSGDNVLSYTESVRMYTFSQMKAMIEKYSLEIMDVSGDYNGSKFSESSPRLIIAGRKVLKDSGYRIIPGLNVSSKLARDYLAGDPKALKFFAADYRDVSAYAAKAESYRSLY